MKKTILITLVVAALSLTAAAQQALDPSKTTINKNPTPTFNVFSSLTMDFSNPSQGLTITKTRLGGSNENVYLGRNVGTSTNPHFISLATNTTCIINDDQTVSITFSPEINTPGEYYLYIPYHYFEFETNKGEYWSNEVARIFHIEDSTSIITPDNPTYVFSLDDTEALTETVAYVPVNMSSTATILGFEFTAHLTPDVQFATDENGKCNVRIADRYADTHHCYTNITESGTLRVAFMSDDNTLIQVGEDCILYIPVITPAETGTSTLIISNIIISTADSQAVRLTDEPNALIIATKVMPGDIDSDGEITIADATATVDIILNRYSGSGISQAADMNKDGEVNLIDVVLIVNQIISHDAPAYGSISNEITTAVAPLFEIVGLESVNDKNIKADILLHNASGFIGAQFDTVLPEGWTFVMNDNQTPKIELCNESAPTHTLAASMIDDSTMRMIIFSMQNRTFTSSDICFASIYLTCEATENTESEGRMENMLLAATDLSGVTPTDCKFTLKVPTSGVDTLLNANEPIYVYSADGCMIANSLDNIAPGLYIVRHCGKASKVLVK